MNSTLAGAGRLGQVGRAGYNLRVAGETVLPHLGLGDDQPLQALITSERSPSSV